MEDTVSFEINMPFGFQYYAVFDGHGGGQVSTYLKLHMKDAIKRHLIEAIIGNDDNSKIDVPQILYNSFKTIINDIPYKISLNTGSTAVVVLRKDKMVWIANVGDSRAIINKGHEAIPLTFDHKPARPDEYKRISSLGGSVGKAYPGDVYRVNGILAVSRAVGDFALAPHVTWKPEITQHIIEEHNHYIFMATDGVWDVLENQDVTNIINKKVMDNDWKDIGNIVINTARQRHSGDNIACILVIL
jgi:serine/threonine protein phosphatase PrpC